MSCLSHVGGKIFSWHWTITDAASMVHWRFMHSTATLMTSMTASMKRYFWSTFDLQTLLYVWSVYDIWLTAELLYCYVCKVCDFSLHFISILSDFVAVANNNKKLAAGFGRHGMLLSASNDTDTALGQHGSDWSGDLATLTFDFGGHVACGWCGSSFSIRIPSLKFVGLAIQNIWCTMCVSISGPDDPDLWPFDRLTLKLVCKLHLRWGTFLPNLGTLLFANATDGQTDKSNGASWLFWLLRLLNTFTYLLPYGRRHNNFYLYEIK